MRDISEIPDQPYWKKAPGNINLEHYASSCPVDEFRFGELYDVIGNVWQWTSSLDKLYPYTPDDGREDAQKPGMRITRGGAWLFGAAATRTATRSRFDPSGVSLSIGFRCAE